VSACLLSGSLLCTLQQPALEAAVAVRVQVPAANAAASAGIAGGGIRSPLLGGGLSYGSAAPGLGTSGLVLPQALPEVRTAAASRGCGVLSGPGAIAVPKAVVKALDQGAAAQRRLAEFQKASPSFANLAPFAQKTRRTDFARTGAGLSSKFYDGALDASGSVPAVSPVQGTKKLIRGLLGATDIAKRKRFEEEIAPKTPLGESKPTGLLRFVPAKWRAKLQAALTLEDAPNVIARGVALGLIIGMTPTVGIQWAAALILSKLFKASTPAAMSLIWLSNPLTLAPLYWLDFKIGSFLFPSAGASPEAWSELLELMSQGIFDSIPQLLGVGASVFLTTLLGGLVLGAALGIPGYFLARKAVRRYQARKKAERLGLKAS